MITTEMHLGLLWGPSTWIACPLFLFGLLAICFISQLSQSNQCFFQKIYLLTMPN